MMIVVRIVRLDMVCFASVLILFATPLMVIVVARTVSLCNMECRFHQIPTHKILSILIQATKYIENHKSASSAIIRDSDN